MTALVLRTTKINLEVTNILHYLCRAINGRIKNKTIMTIEISVGDYGFSHNWTLNVFGKSFFLGQDVKFCKRVLGMEPWHVVEIIGDNDLILAETRTALAEFIVTQLELDEDKVSNIEPWALCAQ